MRKTADNFNFFLDEFSYEGCCGWYARMDGEDASFNIRTDTYMLRVTPSIPRPDVVAAGLANIAECGFRVSFSPPLQNGELVLMLSGRGEILREMRVVRQSSMPSELNFRIMKTVEPFVEMDIARIRKLFMLDSIYNQYKEFFRKDMLERTESSLRDSLCGILADIKTTQHLLAAAWLDELRYKEPEFLAALPDYAMVPCEKLVIDMRGDITGANWHEPETDGRWAGPLANSSLLVPMLAAAGYTIELEMIQEIDPGALDSLVLKINGQPVPLKRDKPVCPCKMSGKFVNSRPDAPFMAMEFMFGAPVREPDNGHDRRLLSFKIKNVAIFPNVKGM